jgi:predicted dehydrogenase
MEYMTKFGIAIIGMGNAGPNRHLPAITNNPEAEIISLCDINEPRLKDDASGRGVNTYTDYNQMVNSEELDAIHICTPPQTHLDIASDVMRANIPVLIEKPVATSSKEVRELIKIRDNTGTPASVVHNRLFLPYVQEAINRVESGEIGDVVSVTMLLSKEDDLAETFRGDWVFDLPGGELGEGSPHQVYVPLRFVDGLGEICGVGKQNYQKYDPPVEFDGAGVEALDKEGRRLISIKMLANSATRDTLFIHGTKGELQVDFVKRGVFVTTNKERYSAKAFATVNANMALQTVSNVLQTGFGFAKRIAYQKMDDPRSEKSNGHYVQIDRFIEAVETDTKVPVTLEESLETVEVLEALQ